MLNKQISANRFPAIHLPPANNFPLKKEFRCFFGTLTIMLAGLLFLTACLQPFDDGRKEEPNVSALQAKIAEAEREYKATDVSQYGTDVELGTYWVTSGVMIEFEMAIATAKGVLEHPVNQNTVNTAAATLQTKIDRFKNARQPGTAPPVDKTALNVKIAEAESIKSQVDVAASPANVADGRYWVIASVMTTFETAINMAKNIRDNASQQSFVDSAVITLNNAINTFNNEKLPGTKTTGFTQLELKALIASADVAKDGVKTSSNGDDVCPAEYWVSQSAFKDLNDAINTAKTASGNVDIPYMTLVNALNIFNSAKILGSTPDKDALFNAILSADQVKNRVVVAASAAQAPYGSGWATEAQWQPFNTAYTNALTAANDHNMSKNAMAKQVDALTTATINFQTALTLNGPGTKIDEITGTITLTDIPNPAPRVYINVDSYGNWRGRNQINLNSVTGTSADLNWTIPLYSDNNTFNPSDGYFYLEVYPSGSGNNSFEIQIPQTPNINNPNANVGLLGPVSLRYITLSGILNVTLDGQPVPRVEISVRSEHGDWLGYTSLTSPGTDAAWSIMLPVFNNSTPIYFSVSGFSANRDNLFNWTNPGSYNAYNQDITGISLNPGSIANPNTPVNPTPLTADTWADGSITSSTPNREVWYSFNVTSGTTYYIWWNDSDSGDNSKSLNVRVTGYNTEGAFIFNDDYAWSSPRSITASSSGTVKLKVNPYSSNDTGTFAIVYSTSNTRPGGASTIYIVLFDINGGGGTTPSPQAASSGSGIKLPGGDGFSKNSFVFDGWIDYNTYNTYSAGSSYTVTGNVTLYANWVPPYTVSFNINGGDGTTPLSQTVSFGTSIKLPGGDGFSKSGCTFGGWTDNDGTYSAGSSYTVTSTVTLYANWVITGDYPGTEVNPIPLIVNTWTDGSITSSTPKNEVWYSFSVSSGKRYYVWWNDCYAGDESKTLDAQVTGYNTDGSSVFTKDDAWLAPQSFVASSSGTVKLKVVPFNSNNNNGTFAIVYNTSGNRPGSGSTTTPIDLTSGYWYTNILSAGTTHTYRFNANSGDNFIIQWEDADNSRYTADIKVGLRREGNTSYDVSVTDTNPIIFPYATSDNYIIEVQGYDSSSGGTYRIKFDYYEVPAAAITAIN